MFLYNIRSDLFKGMNLYVGLYGLMLFTFNQDIT